MKVFSRPRTYLIARPQINQAGVDEYFNEMKQRGDNYGWEHDDERTPTDSEKLVEFAGRICYCSFGKAQGRKTNQDYVGNLIGQGHGSVLEHANFTFLVARCSRGFTHEMVRHRAGFAYSQESTHFRDYNPDTGCLVLDKELITAYLGQEDILEQAIKNIFGMYEVTYKRLREEGVPKKVACSTARQILPIGIESKLVFTGNIRALRHFMEMRGTKHNVWEIRVIALQVYELLKQECPNLLQGLHVVDGEIHSETRKV